MVEFNAFLREITVAIPLAASRNQYSRPLICGSSGNSGKIRPFFIKRAGSGKWPYSASQESHSRRANDYSFERQKRPFFRADLQRSKAIPGGGAQVSPSGSDRRSRHGLERRRLGWHTLRITDAFPGKACPLASGRIDVLCSYGSPRLSSPPRSSASLAFNLNAMDAEKKEV